MDCAVFPLDRCVVRRSRTGVEFENAMAKLWIVHRDPQWRDALVTMASSLDVLAGDPVAAAGFDATQSPRAVLLGIAGDFEAELEFAHRFAPRLAGAAWVLLARPLDVPEVARLFDALPATLVPIASDVALVRRRLRAALAKRNAVSLTTRQRRDALAARFARWFGDLEMPELLAATDPARAALPLLIRGEPGTGRALLARYLHAVGADAEAPFASVVCEPSVDPRSLLAKLDPEVGALPSAGRLTLCLEDVDRLAPGAQRALRALVEDGAGRLPAARLRWIATAGDPRTEDDALDAGLARALAGLTLRIPPLRERPAAVESIAAAMTHALAASRVAQGRHFDAAAVERLRNRPWPGNLRELEAVVRRTLSSTDSDQIGPDDLVFENFDLPILEPEYLPPPREDRAAVLQAEPSLRGEEMPGEPEAGEDSRAGDRSDSPTDHSRPRQPESPVSSLPGIRPDDDAVRRLSAAVVHEVGNPLVGIRTYASMLPTRFDDPEFRSQFSERVESDTRRIEAVLETLARVGGLAPPAREPVDVSALIARLLERERPQIRERRLVVLEELDRAQPFAMGDAEQLRFALGLLLEQALAWMSARGDLYVATRHRADPTPQLRILLRFRAANGTGLGFGENALSLTAVEAVVHAHGGSLAIDSSENETSIVIDLPAASEDATAR